MLQKIKAVRPVYALAAAALIIGVVGLLYFAVGAVFAPTVAAGETIQVYYTGTLTNGTVFDSNVGKQPLQFTVGANQVIPGFDQAVIGMRLNENRTVTIPVDEAYGQVNPALIVQVPISQFGNKTVRTDMVVSELDKQNNQQYQGIVTAVNATTATVDFNSPLAGRTLVFSIKVVGISSK